MTPEHWAFNLLKKMAGKSVYERPNLREIIPFLSALKRMASANPDKSLEEALALLEKVIAASHPPLNIIITLFTLKVHNCITPSES